jgi:serine/threonine-protein kinase
MPTQTNDLQGLTLANERYVITAKLGEGGMGSVYRALDRNLDSDVVIKIPRQAMMEDPEFAARFTREIRSLVKLSHPHIVKVTDVGTWEKTPFAVMQFLPGGSLEDRRRRDREGRASPFEPKQIPRWLDAVALALDYIHAQGYVHRDVKPGNILFDAEGHAFLSDFGVAKVLSSAADQHATQPAMTGTGMVLGTAEYMAPELIMGEPLDGRVDQYALAITVYELLCGRRPFENDTKTKVLVLHTSQEPPALTKWCPALPHRLSQAVLKGLSKHPNDRYPNCAALAAAVAANVQGAAAPEERVRLKCPGCGKSGAMAASDYARLRDRGDRPTCPACKTLLEESSASTERAARTGTTTVSRGNIPIAPPAPTDPELVRGGTTAMSTPKSHGEKPTDREPRPIASRPPAKTLIEQALPPAGESAGAAPAIIVNPPQPDGARAVTGSAASAIQKRIIIGAAGATALVLMMFFVMGLFPRKDPQPAAPAPRAAADVGSPRAPTVPVAPSRRTDESASAEPSSTGPLEKPSIASTSSSRPPASDTTKPESDEGRSALGPAVASRLEKTERPEPSPTVGSTAPPAAAEAKPLPIGPARPRFDTAQLARKPTKGRYGLAKLVGEAKAHSNQIVIPSGMYLLTRPHTDRASGARKLWATGRTIQSKRGNTVGMTSATGIELEVDPGLADRLASLADDQLIDKMAIVSVWFPSGAAPELVKAEILQRYVTGFRKGFGPRGDVDYETLVVTPQGSTVAKADDEDWEQPERMLHFANVYKNRVAAYKNMLRTNEQLQLQSIMGNLWGQMMRDAAAEAARQGALQRAVGGR